MRECPAGCSMELVRELVLERTLSGFKEERNEETCRKTEKTERQSRKSEVVEPLGPFQARTLDESLGSIS